MICVSIRLVDFCFYIRIEATLDYKITRKEFERLIRL